MGGLGNPIHLAFIAIIALIFLGPKRLPELAKSLGTGMREFRETMSLSGEHHEAAPDPMLAVAAEAPPAPAPIPDVAPPVAPVAPAPVAPPPAPDPS